MCSRNNQWFASVVMGALLTSVAWLAAPVLADDAAEQIKELTRKISSIQRNISTSPTRAETEWLQAREVLNQLKAATPNNDKIPALEKQLTDLGVKLEKRLGHPLGESAAEKPAPTEEDKDKDKTPPSSSGAAAASGLPNTVTSRLDKMNQALDAVESALEKNQLQSAKRKLSEAQKAMDEIQQRYAKNIPADNAQMKAATERLAAVGEKYTQAESTAAAAAAAEAQKQEKCQAQSKEWMAKFSPFFDYKSDQYLLMGSSFNTAEEDVKQKCRQAYAQANELMATYKNTDFPYGKTQELKYLEQQLTGYLTIYNEGETRAQQELACGPWVGKLRQYADVGAGSDKYLIVGATFGEDEINRRAALLEEAKALWGEYEKAQFPLGKTAQLVQLEKDMQQKLQEMPESLRQSRALVSGDLEKEFDRVLGYLNQDTGWRTDESKTPNIVMQRDVEPLQEALKRFASTVQPDDAKLAALRDKLAQIEKADQENRAVRAKRTYLAPDKYAGDDADALRRKVEDIVKEKVDGAKPLRITLPAAAWKEESVVEWTDTTHTALRHRITRFMTTQVAAKSPDGKVYLHSVHLAADRQSDGSWGALYGHIMWSDWMAEENVKK